MSDGLNDRIVEKLVPLMKFRIVFNGERAKLK